jgi:Fic family protein
MRKPRSPPCRGEIISGFEGCPEKFILDGKMMETAEEYNRKYLHWDIVKDLCGDSKDSVRVWGLMKLLRRGGLEEITFGKITIRYSVIRDFLESLHKIDTMPYAEPFRGDFMNRKNRPVYAVSSVMEESVASCQIEGASVPLRQAKKMLRENRPPKNKSERMVFNEYSAMKYVKSKKDSPLTPELIKEIHRIITEGTLEDGFYEGRFRDTDGIAVCDTAAGEILHKPIPYADIESAIDSVCDYINSEENFEHPIIKGIILHFIIAYIHPFIDGNGRLARALFYWYSLKKGYGTMEYLSISKAIKADRGKYDLAYLLSETDGNDVTYFIKFHLGLIEDALYTFGKYVKRKADEQKELENKITGLGNLNSRQKSVLNDAVRSDEPFSVYCVREKYRISYQTARTDILKLIDLGYVKVSGRDGNMVLYSYSGN